VRSVSVFVDEVAIVVDVVFMAASAASILEEELDILRELL